MNRLTSAPSPYLRQHADNPVHWWPWGPEAWAEAARRDVPVLVSIGYATCHWCHVMAHECFEDEQVAAVLNAAFVCIKVDREERPDVDAAYMAFLQATRGNGGWPLNVWCAPDKRPFFGATYVPRDDRRHHPGITTLTDRIIDAWQTRRDDLMAQADHVAAHLAAAPAAADADAPTAWPADAEATAEASLVGRIDPATGGIGGPPKFPMPATLDWLLGRPGPARDGAATTLRAMVRGGVHDHVGGGFHRYSTDAHWLVPHFEKMAYDQGLILASLAHAHAASTPAARDHDGAKSAARRAELARAMQRLVTYVHRDLCRDDGLICSGEDADSEGEEGTFTTWPYPELVDLVGSDFAATWGARPEGNFDDEASGQPVARNILHWPATGAGPVDATYDDALDALLAVRARRERPLRDDKALADWNWLWVRGLARAGAALGEDAWLAAAASLADRLLATFGADPVRHCELDGVTGAFLDDQAFAAWASLALFEATGEPRWLDTAETAATGLARYLGPRGYTIASASSDGEALPPAPINAHDGALPSGNGVAAFVQARLWTLTGDARWRDAAEDTLRRLAPLVRAAPAACPMLLSARSELDHGTQVVVVGKGEGDDADCHELLAAARANFDANRVVLHATPALRQRLAWLANYRTPGAYVCRDRACQAPVTDAAALRAGLAPNL